jgi:hypothetical protein
MNTMALFSLSRRPDPPNTLFLVGLGLLALGAGVTAFASVQLLVEARKWNKLRKPLADFLNQGTEAMKVPIKSQETTAELIQDLTTIAKGAVLGEDLQQKMNERRLENQTRIDNEQASKARVQAKKADADATAAEARAKAAQIAAEEAAKGSDPAAASKAKVAATNAEADAIGARARAGALQIEAEAAAAKVAAKPANGAGASKPENGAGASKPETPAQGFLREGAE